MTAVDRQLAESAERMAGGVGDVALTVGAWAGTVGFGLVMGLVAFVAGAR